MAKELIDQLMEKCGNDPEKLEDVISRAYDSEVKIASPDSTFIFQAQIAQKDRPRACRLVLEAHLEMCKTTNAGEIDKLKKKYAVQLTKC